jgi:alpha-N-acetylglucosamine transferase
MIPMGEPFRTIVRVLLAVLTVFIVLWVIVVLLGMAGISVPIFGGLR